MTEYVQLSIPYSLQSGTILNFYITTNTLLYQFSIQSSIDGENWNDIFPYLNFFNTEYFITDSFSIIESGTRFFKINFIDSKENFVELKEFSLYEIEPDGNFRRIIPIFSNDNTNLTNPVIPSSLIGAFTVTSAVGSYGPANLFDLTKETVYISDESFDIYGNYLGTDRVSTIDDTYLGTFIDIQLPYTINFDSYSLISSDKIHKFPKRWILLGSTDGVKYSNVLDTFTFDSSVTPFTCYSFEVDDKVTPYKSIRIVIQNTFAAVQCEFSEFSLSSFMSGGRIIPVTIQPITSENTVTFGVSLGNAREVYSGIYVENPEWIKVKFPYYPGIVKRIDILGDYLPSDVNVYSIVDSVESLIASINRNLSVTGKLSITNIDDWQTTSHFKFEFNRLQPNVDGYAKIKINEIIFYDSFGNRMNFLWDPVINYFTSDESGLNVITEKTIEGGEYIGEERSYIKNSNIYIYGEYYQLSYPSPIQSNGFYINTNGLSWYVLGSNDEQQWDILYFMNPFIQFPEYPSLIYTRLDEYSIKTSESVIIRSSEPNIDLQNLLLLDSFQKMNGEDGFPVNAISTNWYNGVSPQYGYTGRDPSHYTFIPGLDPTSYDFTLQAEYFGTDEDDPTQYVPKAIDGVYGVYFDFTFPQKVNWNGMRLFIRRYGSIPVFSPRWVFFFASNDGENWTMFTRPQKYDFGEFFSLEKARQDYTYLFDPYNDYFTHYRFQVASAGTGNFDIGSIQWIGDSDPHEIFRTINVPSSYSKYKAVITNSNASTTAVFNDFTILDFRGERIDGLYSGGEYHGTSSYQGIRGEYINIDGSCEIISSQNTFKKLTVVNQDGTTQTFEDDRVAGTYLCDSLLIFSSPPTLPSNYELLLECPTSVRIGSFSFKTDNLIVHYNASLPVNFVVLGSDTKENFQVIQEYNESLQYDVEYTFQLSSSRTYTYYKFYVATYNKVDTFLSIYNFQMYSPLGFPVISDDGNVVPNITRVTAKGPAVLVFENVESLDGNLHIDDVILT